MNMDISDTNWRVSRSRVFQGALLREKIARCNQELSKCDEETLQKLTPLIERKRLIEDKIEWINQISLRKSMEEEKLEMLVDRIVQKILEQEDQKEKVATQEEKLERERQVDRRIEELWDMHNVISSLFERMKNERPQTLEEEEKLLYMFKRYLFNCLDPLKGGARNKRRS